MQLNDILKHLAWTKVKSLMSHYTSFLLTGYSIQHLIKSICKIDLSLYRTSLIFSILFCFLYNWFCYMFSLSAKNNDKYYIGLWVEATVASSRNVCTQWDGDTITFKVGFHRPYISGTILCDFCLIDVFRIGPKSFEILFNTYLFSGISFQQLFRISYHSKCLNRNEYYEFYEFSKQIAHA